MKKSKVMKITAIAVVIVLIAGAVIWKMLGIRAEGEENQIDTSKWDTENRVNIVYDEDGVPVPVPKGYTASSILREVDGDGKVIKGKEGERTVNTGFVIYEGEEDIISDETKAMEDGEEKNQAIEQDIENAQTTRNQWVWVPVANAEEIYWTLSGKKLGKLYDFNYINNYYRLYQDSNRKGNYIEPYALGMDSDKLPNMLAEESQAKLLKDFQMEFERTINSIEQYGGYYIGRYETGDLSKQKARIVKENEDIYNSSWYTLYRKTTEIVPNENKNVRTNMIWGCLWDRALWWMYETGNGRYLQGNTYYYSFSYKKSDGTVAKKNQNKAVIIPTGSTEISKYNNIYDMSGNLWEATMEFYVTNTGYAYNVYRGLSYTDNSDGRPGRRKEESNLSFGGTRAILYIRASEN